MNEQVANLEPQAIWTHFEQLNEIPRGSKKEQKAVEFVRQFGERLGLETIVDEVGNVIIRKPATPGMENRKGIILQSHLDMVHQKNSDVDFDFDTQGIQSYIDGEWVKAKGTTLGADNGIGVATILAVLADKNLKHGPIEGLFTIDEETGMTGAFALKGGLLQGEVLLNLDSEDEGELYIGCAGGIDNTVTFSYKEETVPAGYTAFKITVKGLKGGHSGGDIHLGRGNANKIMNRLLLEASGKISLRIDKIDGGGLRNAIPRESFAWVAVPQGEAGTFTGLVRDMGETLAREFHNSDPGVQLLAVPAECSACLPEGLQVQLLRTLDTAPNGVYAMSQDMEGLVETSTNLARVLVEGGSGKIMFLTRSSVESRKMDLSRIIESAFFFLKGASVAHAGSYPGWEPNPGSPILKVMQQGYRDLFGTEPKVMAIHAGLECGILGRNYPGMDMISFGPTIRNPHSPDEMVHIGTVKKFWDYLLYTLENAPVKS